MVAPTQAQARQVWIYIDEGDSYKGRSLAQRILETLRAAGCPGATIMRGVGGYGVHGIVRTDLIVDAPSALPLIITFVDRADRVAAVLPTVREMVAEGLITITPVEIVQATPREAGPFPSHLTVADVMSHDPAVATPGTPLAELVSLLIERDLRALPVVTPQRRVLGIITDGDLLARGATTLPLRIKQLLPQDERAARLEHLAQQPQHAADLMTPDPVTLLATTPLAQAAAIMAERNLKRIPVVDALGQLVGIVSRSDLLKTVAAGPQLRASTPTQLPAGAPTEVADLMLSDVPVVHPVTPLAETFDQLLATPNRRVVVVDADRRVVGIISDGDVLRRAARRIHGGALRRLAAWLSGGERPEGLELAAKGRTAAEVMTSPVITVTPSMPIAEATALMMSQRVKWLPVVDADERLIGMIGRATLLSALGRSAG
ncbi:MAG: DUF190 domain-containing protein [Oscillochloridaceae bacterium umkhey_bin13]